MLGALSHKKGCPAVGQIAQPAKLAHSKLPKPCSAQSQNTWLQRLQPYTQDGLPSDSESLYGVIFRVSSSLLEASSTNEQKTVSHLPLAQSGTHQWYTNLKLATKSPKPLQLKIFILLSGAKAMGAAGPQSTDPLIDWYQYHFNQASPQQNNTDKQPPATRGMQFAGT